MVFLDLRKVSPLKRPRLVARALILLSLVISSCSSSTQQSSPIVISTQQMNDPYLGDANARITIIEYGDFGCPTCRGWEKSGVLKEIRQKYGNQVKFVWRDFPVITPESPKAA
jgi:protein-disulfide isomerase